MRASPSVVPAAAVGAESIARLTLFVVITLGLTTLALVPVALSISGKLHLPGAVVGAAGFVSVFGPLIASVAVTARTSSLRVVFARLTVWRVGVQWYALAIFGPLVLLGTAFLLYRSLGGHPFPWPKPTQLATLPVLFAFAMVEAVGEEVGWRGYLLPALRTRLGFLPASLAWE